MDKKSPDLGHSADRDSHFLAAPPVPLEEHVGYVVAARFHDQSLDLAYLAVGRTDGQFPADVYLTGWDGVDSDLLRGFRPGSAAHTGHKSSEGCRKKVHPSRGVLAPGGVEVRHDLSLLGGLERLELGEGAAKPELTRRSVDKVNRNKPA